MSLDPPTYLSSLQNNIRARPIPWEGAVRAGTITDNDLKTIKAVDKVRKEQRKQTVESDIEAYQSLILGGTKGRSVLDSASKRPDVIQYMLVLTGDLINGTIHSIGNQQYGGLTDRGIKMLPRFPPSCLSTSHPTSRSFHISHTPLTLKTQYHFLRHQSLHLSYRLPKSSHRSRTRKQTKPLQNSTLTFPP